MEQKAHLNTFGEEKLDTCSERCAQSKLWKISHYNREQPREYFGKVAIIMNWGFAFNFENKIDAKSKIYHFLLL